MADQWGQWSNRRTRILAALAITAVLAGAVAIASTRDDPPRRTTVSATGDDTASVVGDDASASTSTSAEPAPTTIADPAPVTTSSPPTTVGATPTTATPPPRPAPTAPVTVGSDPAGTWTLVRHDDAAGSCLELQVQTFRSERLLCHAPAAEPGKVLGDLLTMNTPIGRAVVAIVERRIESWGASPYQQQHVAVLEDPAPARSSYAYAVGVSRMMGGGASLRLFFSIGENTVGRSDIAVGDAVVRPGQSLTKTDEPYGEWPGYRRGGTTGLYWGGNEEFGFYDGKDGGRCVLYRRLGGDPEAKLFDICSPRSAGGGVAFSSVVPLGPPYAVPALVVLADGLQVVRWSCTTPLGTSCGATDPSTSGAAFGRGAQLTADPGGSGRQLIGWFPERMPDLGGAREITVTMFSAGDRQVARLTIPVP